MSGICLLFVFSFESFYYACPLHTHLLGLWCSCDGEYTFHIVSHSISYFDNYREKNENILKCCELKYKIKEARPSVCQKAGSEECGILITEITDAFTSKSANIIYTLFGSEPTFRVNGIFVQKRS